MLSNAVRKLRRTSEVPWLNRRQRSRQLSTTPVAGRSFQISGRIRAALSKAIQLIRWIRPKLTSKYWLEVQNRGKPGTAVFANKTQSKAKIGLNSSSASAGPKNAAAKEFALPFVASHWRRGSKSSES